MKKVLFALSFIVFLLTSCHSGKKAQFYLELVNCEKNTPILLYVADATGALQLTEPDTLYTGRNGKLSFSIELEKPQFILIKSNTAKLFYNSTPLFITQEGDYNLQLSPSKTNNDVPMVLIDGENSMGVIELIRFENEKKLMNFNTWFDSTSSSNLYNSFDQLISKSLLTINQLKTVKRIDDDFYNYAVNYVEYYLSFNTLQYIENRITKVDTTQKRVLNEQKLRIFNRCPISNPNLYQTSVGKEYIDMYLSEIIAQDKANYDIALKNSNGQTFLLGHLKKLLHKDVYQYYALEYLWAKTIRLDKETITLWSAYCKEFPENRKLPLYQKMQKEAIPNINSFYAKGNGVLNPGIFVLDDVAPITSFRDAVASFKGNYVFIDIWASWCPDCIKEFEHNTELKSFLKSNEIACLYISLERSPDRDKWKLYLNKYNLIGSHILINDALREDLYKVLGTTSLWIPRYILVDPNGNIVLPEGALPSDGTKLFDQINQIKQKEQI